LSSISMPSSDRFIEFNTSEGHLQMTVSQQ
jgi:hypothetical protein